MSRKIKILCSVLLIFSTLIFYIHSKTNIDVRIEVQEILSDGNVKFRIANYGKAVSYTGYPPASPLCDVEVKRNGKWVQVTNHWCGTGLESLILKSKKALNLKYANYHSKDETWRLKLNVYDLKKGPSWMNKLYSYLKLGSDEEVIVYSKPVKARLKSREITDLQDSESED